MRTFLLISCIAFLLGGSALLFAGKNVELLATTVVLIGAEPTIDPSATKTIEILAKGARVDVLACLDLKHYLVPEVRLQDARIGYVIGGQFELTTKRLSPAFDKPIVFSCPLTSGD